MDNTRRPDLPQPAPPLPSLTPAPAGLPVTLIDDLGRQGAAPSAVRSLLPRSLTGNTVAGDGDARTATELLRLPGHDLGDLNILEPGHRPRYPFFAPFEYDFYRSLVDRHRMTDVFRHLHPDQDDYSWVGRTGDGYRYDHAFCSSALSDRITACDYVHEPRHSRLSDHSALSVTFSLAMPELAVSDPAAALTPQTLF